jgi:hypothetical protein
MRKLNDGWLENYIRLIETASESPRQYHVWSAATVIAATLKRHVWVNRADWHLFPNMYSVLVGHPGLGKGRAINPAVAIARKANTVNLLSDKLTIQYILERLSQGFTQGVHVNAQGQISVSMPSPSGPSDTSCLISAPELEVFLTTSEALPSLADLWDCRDGPVEYGTRGKGLVSILKPAPSLLGGCTPRQVALYMSTNAVSGGFTRRVNFVVAEAKARSIPWPAKGNGSFDALIDGLVHDLRHIGTLQGQFEFKDDAKPLFEGYYNESGKLDEFQDEATSAYATTKWAHVTKLAMVLSVSRDDSLVITATDLENAISLVEKCSQDLARVFRSVGDSDMVANADRVLRFLELVTLASIQEMMSVMWKHMSKQELESVLVTLETGNMITHRDVKGMTKFMMVPTAPTKGQTTP